MAVGALALVGWTFDIEVLRSVLPWFMPMYPNPAICFILSSVATADEVPLPGHLSGEALRDYQRLIVIPRPWFDRLYVYMMYKWHAIALRGYQEAAKTVTEPKLRAWAEQSLPIIQDHFEAIQRIAIAKGIPMNSGDDPAHDSEILTLCSPLFDALDLSSVVKP